MIQYDRHNVAAEELVELRLLLRLFRKRRTKHVVEPTSCSSLFFTELVVQPRRLCDMCGNYSQAIFVRSRPDPHPSSFPPELRADTACYVTDCLRPRLEKESTLKVKWTVIHCT